MFKSITKKFYEWRNSGTTSSDSFMIWILIIMVAVGPFFFIPIHGMSVIAGKGYFFIALGLLMFLGYCVSILKRGEITIAKNWVFRTLGLILGVEFLGAIFSPAFSMSIFGHGFETTSWIFLLTFFIVSLIAYRILRTYERIGIIYCGIIIGAIIAMFIQIVHFLIGGSHFTLGVLTSTTSSLVGSWIDLGVLLSFIVLFCMITLELGGLKKGIRIFVLGLGAFALAMLAFMNLHTVWIILGSMSLVTALYIFTFAYWNSETKEYRKHRAVPWFSLAVVVLSVVFIFFGPTLNNLASRHQNIVSNDVKLSISATARVSFQSLIHNPATGYGPNTFSNVWNLAKPPSISQTNFATAQFSYGSGFIPTQLATNGILGIILWMGLIIMILMVIVKALIKGFESSIERYVIALLSMSILFLLVTAWFMVISSYILIIFAVLLGALIGISADKRGETAFTKSFMSDPRASFFGILGVTVLIIVIIFAGYLEMRKIVGAVYAVKGTNAETAQNINGAINDFSLATAYSPDDVYDRELSALTINQVNQLSSTITNANRTQVIAQAQSILGTALGHAQAAVAIDPADYQNFVAVGNVYRTLTVLGVAGSADSAQTAYTKAQKLNPHDPTMFLSFAQLDLAQNDTANALVEIADSINYYPNVSAYLLRAQVELSKQDTTNAITSMEAALTLNPYDANVAYELGLLFYNQSDYAHAIAAFKTAIYDNRSLGVAYGYLGVSYEKSGDMTDANTVYDYMRKQSDQADTLINQIKNGSTPSATTSSTITTPSTLKLPTKQVAPTSKKK